MTMPQLQCYGVNGLTIEIFVLDIWFASCQAQYTWDIRAPYNLFSRQECGMS